MIYLNIRPTNKTTFLFYTNELGVVSHSYSYW